ncbi:hypothetical protein LSH36_1404g00023 [Paralvinella palmiformis]|uniref:Uncharacterized protein n=1 Tax=Paralvinella palmiformis TaxID=53620 RepID=A0AAD9MQR5_9ANNE|nr:hypothetical protein LSH36_1404g00023 [Paralvinella palmiformis]
MPMTIRNLKNCPVDHMKRQLDKFLATVPDELQILGYTAQRRSEINSLLDMVQIASALRGQEGGDCESVTNQTISAKERDRNILLAIFREITGGMIKPEVQRPNEQIKEAIGNMLLKDHGIHQQDLLSRLLTNRLAAQCRHLSVDDNHDPERMTLIEILVHYWIVISSTEAGTLLEPLCSLVNQPQNMRQSYLPTMPEDHLEEVRTALLEARRTVRGSDYNPVMWVCPNGHPYVIGDNVSQLVRQPAQVDDISEFLWQHLVVDLEVVAKSLGRNKEEATLFMHLLFKRMLSVETPGLQAIDATLMSKEARRKWEARFTENYIAPILSEFEQILPDINNQLASDNRLGNNPLMCVLYDVNQDTDKHVDVENIQEENSMWSIHTRITVEHLTQEFLKTCQQSKKLSGTKTRGSQDREILRLFLQEEHHLRMLRCLPGIVQLQHMLACKFHHNIDSADAIIINIGEFKQKYFEEHQREEFEELIAIFNEAWDQLRGEIGTFAVGGSTVPAEYCEQTIDDNTCLAMLLPTLHGQGLCATALVYHLVKIHNDFMEEYSQMKKQALVGNISSQDVTKHLLVSYDLEKDLLPIILANCNYSLTAGQHTRMEYDFIALARQIEERFIRGKPRINADVPLIVFRKEFTNASVFMELEKKIQQESLSSHQQQQIIRGFRHLMDVNDGLATLDITIGFLVSVSGEKDMALLDFIKEKLKMECGMLGRVAQKCCLKHAESLWLLLSYERAKHLTEVEQDAFEQLSDVYHEEVEDDVRQQLFDYFQRLHQLESFLPRLYEFMILHVAKTREDPNSEDYVDNTNQPLGYVLATYLDSRDYPEIPSLTDQQFPDEVCVKHCVSTWKIAMDVFLRH